MAKISNLPAIVPNGSETVLVLKDGVAARASIAELMEHAPAFGTIISAITVKKETRANLNTDLAWPAGSVALVYADSTALNNDLYVKTGASGVGSWGSSLGIFGAASAAYIAPSIAEAATSAITATQAAAAASVSAASIAGSGLSIQRSGVISDASYKSLDSGGLTVTGIRTSAAVNFYLNTTANVFSIGGFQGPANGLPDGVICEYLEIPVQVSGADHVKIEIWRRGNIAASGAPGTDPADLLVETITPSIAAAGLVDGAPIPAAVRAWLTTPFVSDSSKFLPGYTVTSVASGVSIETGFGLNAAFDVSQALRGFTRAGTHNHHMMAAAR